MSTQLSYEEGLRRLATRSFGGSDVAVSPDWNDDGFWPAGPSAPAADEAISWLRDRVTAAQPSMVFLVGGPGNGKSYLSSVFVDGWAQVDLVDDGLAHRTYRYEPVSDTSVVVVNDATIGRADGATPPLVTDLNEAIAGSQHVLANVNRGILFEELADGPTGDGAEVLRWLATDESKAAGDVAAGFVRSRTFSFHGVSWPVVAVFMDTCSLLEARPSTYISMDGHAPSIDSHRYSVQRLTKRSAEHDTDTAAGTSWSRLQDSLTLPSEARHHDPYAANLVSLSSPAVRSGVLSILRAAEIAAGRRLTYRELWGAVARVVIGDAATRAEDGDPLGLVPDEPPEDFSDVIALGRLRFHQTLFAADASSVGSSASSPVTDPVTALTALVDCVKDARPGWRANTDDGWASPVLEAFAGHATGESPLKALEKTLETAPEGPRMQVAITSFDRWLDARIVDKLRESSLSDAERRRIVAWYGEYLLRLYAVANGIPAFAAEIELWTRAWRNAEKQQLPKSLESALRTLLFPAPEDALDGGFLIPVLAARAETVGRAPREATLVASMPAGWSLRSRSTGDRLSVALRQDGVDLVELDLDFAMVREALACHARNEGVTEFTDTASPRLERFRSTLLREQGPVPLRYAIVDSGSIYDVEMA